MLKEPYVEDQNLSQFGRNVSKKARRTYFASTEIQIEGDLLIPSILAQSHPWKLNLYSVPWTAPVRYSVDLCWRQQCITWRCYLSVNQQFSFGRKSSPAWFSIYPFHPFPKRKSMNLAFARVRPIADPSQMATTSESCNSNADNRSRCQLLKG